VIIGEGVMIPASQICDNPAHPGTIPIDETLAQELQFQADTANNVLLNLPSAVRVHYSFLVVQTSLCAAVAGLSTLLFYI
jgi:hypothetical protein